MQAKQSRRDAHVCHSTKRPVSLDSVADKLIQPPTNDEATAGSALGDFVSLKGKIRQSKNCVKALKGQILDDIPEEDCPQVLAHIAQNYA